MTRSVAITPLLLLGLGAVLSAQCPPASGIRLTGPGGPGIYYIDPLGAVGPTRVQGGSPELDAGVKCGALNPVTGELWVDVKNGTNTEVRRLIVQGQQVILEIPLTSQPIVAGTNGFRGLAFDNDGNLFVTDGKSLYVIDRDTGAFSTWTSAPGFSGTMTGLTFDSSTDTLYASATGFGGKILAWDTTAGPSPGVVAFSSATVEMSQTGIAVDPVGRFLYLSTISTAGNSVLRIGMTGGTVTPVSGTPPIAFAGIDHDPTTGRLHLVGIGDSLGVPSDDNYYTLKSTGGTAIMVTSTSFAGSPTGVVVNDFLDETRVNPKYPSAAALNVFEFTAHGRAGDPAGTALVAANGVPVNPQILGLGICDVGGVFTSKLPFGAGSFTSGDVLTILSARFDVASGALVFGSTFDIVFQP